MASDNDLAALLPEAPPPRPAQRETAIDAAMRRFDGEEDRTPAPAPARARDRSPGWLGRPQFASAMALALVAVVSSTVWLAQRDQFVAEHPEIAPPPRVQPPGATPSASASAAAAEPAARVSPGAADRRVEEAADRAGSAAPAEASTLSEEAAAAVPQQSRDRGFGLAEAGIEQNLNRLPQFAPPASAPAAPPPPPPPPPPASMAPRAAARAASPDSLVVTGSRIARQDFESNSPVVTVQEPPAPAGDWNACTVTDPARNLQACRAFADPAAPGAAGRAAAALMDGMTFAWRGELDPAIAAFDRAIAARGGLSIAYLNRGLVHHLKGDLPRALADLDQAIAADPRSARGYYHRSLVRRMSGNAAGAAADAARAIELEPSYRAVLP